MSVKPIRFGIVGAGMIGALHLQAIAKAGGVAAAVMDRHAESAGRFAAAHGLRPYSELKALLDDPEIDAVTIATPSGLHGEIAIAAARAGKHVFCEKPMEITVERCDAVIRACDEAGIVFTPVFQSRFTRPVQLVKEAMTNGRFGRMVLASAQVRWFRNARYYSASDWRGTWRYDGGGALMNQSIHAVDMLLYINGDPEEVFAVAGTLTHSIEVEDNLCATVKYRNGSFGTLEVSTSCAPGFSRRVEFSGSGGTVAFEENQITRWEFVDKAEEDAAIAAELSSNGHAAGGRNPSGIDLAGHVSQLTDFMDAIRHHRQPFLTGREGRRAVELICGVYESVRTGRPHQFPR